MLAEEVVADVLARLDDILLELAVDDFFHPPDEQTAAVGFEDRIPIGAPDDLDDVPAGSAEDPFELLNDLAVPADGAVEPLQIAVHDPGQVVEPLSRTESNRPERFGFVDLSIAEERPDVGLRRIEQTAMFDIPQEPGLIERTYRAEAHRNRGKLPEVGHQPRMWIRRESRTHAATRDEIS